MDTRSRFPAFLMQPDTLGQISLLSLCFSDTGRNGLDSVAAGEWEMCITGYAAKLWEMLFAGCGKAAFAFPQAVNSIFHGEAASYAHFPLAFLAQSALFCLSSVATTFIWCSDRSAPALCRGFGALPNKRGKRQAFRPYNTECWG